LEAIKQLNLTNYITVVDRYVTNEEAALYLSAADLLVAPYRRKTGSAVVQMARGFGLPVITTGNNEDLANRLTVPPGDVLALADALVGFLNSGFSGDDVSSIDNQPPSWEELVLKVEKCV
jgi:glycosyltransferase involved in cell wall biosynthesis